MVELDVEAIDYERYSNRQLAAGPLALILLALLVIGGWHVATGAPVDPGIEFTGGVELRVEATGGPAEIQAAFPNEANSIQSVAGQTDTYVVTFQIEDLSEAQALADQAESEGLTVLSTQSTSASFAESAQRLALLGVVAAFVGMSIVVFLLFRTAIPSIAVVLSAFGDIVVPVAVMNLVGIQLSLGTVAALLMLIGYSVDSDILLNNHILRRSGEFYESTYRAMRTGVTMTLTSLSASIVMAIVATIFGIGLLAAIGTVLAIGLAVDLVNTYLLNLSLLRRYRGLDGGADA
jgi:preprotein translocase subunit SecF